MTDIDRLRKKRSTIKGTMTKLQHRLEELERTPERPNLRQAVALLLEKAQAAERDYRSVHEAIVELIDINEEVELSREQETLDRQEEVCEDVLLRLRVLTNVKTITDEELRTIEKRIRRLMNSLREVSDKSKDLEDDDNPRNSSMVQQFAEELLTYKEDARKIEEAVFELDLEEEHPLIGACAALNELRFNCACANKDLLKKHDKTNAAKATTSNRTTSKLPKMEVPTFNGDTLRWRGFWDLFKVSVHDQESMCDSEKLVYLCQAVKQGSAGQVIEGLSHTGDQYNEAVQCLKKRYDQPREVHEAYVKVIVEYPKLKEGLSKDIRKLHDVMLQNLRALKTMGYDVDSKFMTALIQLKLDTTTSFEWKKASQDSPKEVPDHEELLKFLDQRARCVSDDGYLKKPPHASSVTIKKPFVPYTQKAVSTQVAVYPTTSRCSLCTKERHPLYACSQFKEKSGGDQKKWLMEKNACFNCLRSGHKANQCPSQHRCRTCQRPHHTMLHDTMLHDSLGRRKSEEPQEALPKVLQATKPSTLSHQVTTNAVVMLQVSSLLMTCKVVFSSPDGRSVEARAMLDPGSTTSFITQRMASSLGLPRTRQRVQISGISGITTGAPVQTVASCTIKPVFGDGESMSITAIVLPKVTREMPTDRIPRRLDWDHLDSLNLADPTFGEPGKIDALLGVEVYVNTLRHGRRYGPAGSPTALETGFGWVLCGNAEGVKAVEQKSTEVVVQHSLITSTEDLLRRFWEIEEVPKSIDSTYTPDERAVMEQFESSYRRSAEGRFVVELPRSKRCGLLGESRSQAVRRFHSLERSLYQKNKFEQVNEVIQEYTKLEHAEAVPEKDLYKSPEDVFYMPIHVVYKATSTTTKVRAVFDASAKSSSGISLNDTLLVGPTVHPQLVDVLIKFREHRIALTTDISKMYRAVELASTERDFHRFVWRQDASQSIRDYRMTRVTFGVAASSFAANMAVRSNAVEFASEYPMAARVTQDSFYVDDGLTGADTVEDALRLREQLQELFSKACFQLRKWNSSDSSVLSSIPEELRENREVLPISAESRVAKTLGIQWDTKSDAFMLATSDWVNKSVVTKRMLLSDVSRVFDVLGWFTPSTISMKILLQRTWELKIGWDEQIPESVEGPWKTWRADLPQLALVQISRCYYLKEEVLQDAEIHGFSDASQEAYAAVAYLRSKYVSSKIHISLIVAKSKVAPIKRQTIPRLELCGALMLIKILKRLHQVLQIPVTKIFAWTDSTIVLDWLGGSSRKLDTFVGNRVSQIVECLPQVKWRHVAGLQNPADCASRGISATELIHHDLWWTGPPWLMLDEDLWPVFVETTRANEDCRVFVTSVEGQKQPIVGFDVYSTAEKLIRVVAWIMRFISKMQSPRKENYSRDLSLTEVQKAEEYLVAVSQEQEFGKELERLKSGKQIHKASSLRYLFPFVDKNGLIRAGGRIERAEVRYNQKCPVILRGGHEFSKLLIRDEHIRLLHAGPVRVYNLLSERFHLVGGFKTVRSVCRRCITCRRFHARPRSQLPGQLPKERITPSHVFDNVGVDYAGPFLLKLGRVRKPVIVKAYVCVFVSMSVKAVHLEVVTDLTSEAFIATLRRFIARRGLPTKIFSDNGTNFVGANNYLQDLYTFLNGLDFRRDIENLCVKQRIQWKFIPEHAPHFGGLWEAVVKSVKTHLRKIVGTVKLTYEELTTVLAQVEASLNSRPLVRCSADGECLEALTPGHFLIGKPMCALPQVNGTSPNLLKRWQLCQELVGQFWTRWSKEYLVTLRRFSKWVRPGGNLEPGDVVLVCEDGVAVGRWPLARVQKVFSGCDGVVRVATVKTVKGVYKRPVMKLCLLLKDDTSWPAVC